MKTLLSFVAILLAAPAAAQTTAPPVSPMNQGSGPASAPGQSSLGGALVHDLSGQPIFDSKDMRIGTVRAMGKDSEGAQAVLLTVEKIEGLSGQVVNLPVSSLHPRAGGGYTTTISTAELKARTAP